MSSLHPSCVRINELLDGHQVTGRVQILPEVAPTARAAAEQVGCEVGAIANSLIFSTDAHDPLLIMTSGAHRVDPAKVAALIGVGIHRASADFVRQHTSQPIGGVAPLGHPRPITTLVDRDLSAFPQLWASGGIPHAVFPLSYADLVRITDGQEADVA